ncbi:MAG: AraC family ligand binding domain-containing protein, partial [Oscillospiraceae bacterium]|nr:AraC family ligand binding domain-containing protein [Oscillospiraceae bacterium]
MGVLDFPHPGIIPSLCRTREEYNVLAKLPVHIYAVDSKTTNEIHWHDYTQIWYTVSGSYYHTVNGVRSLQTAGCVSVIYPYSVHAVDTLHTVLEDTRIICISKTDKPYLKNIHPIKPQTYTHAAFENSTLQPFTQ